MPAYTTLARCAQALDRTFSLDQKAAVAHVEQGHAKGKIVVTLSPAEVSLLPHSPGA